MGRREEFWPVVWRFAGIIAESRAGGDPWDAVGTSLDRTALAGDGVTIGDRVAGFLPNCPEAVITTGLPKCMVHGAGGTLLQHQKEHLLHVDLRPGARGSRCSAPAPAMLALAEKERLAPALSHDPGPLRTLISTGGARSAHSYRYVYDSVKADLHLCNISGGTELISRFAIGNPLEPVWAGELQGVGLGMAVRWPTGAIPTGRRTGRPTSSFPVETPEGPDERIVLFVQLADGLALDEDLRERIRRRVREGASPRHVPHRVIQVADLPRTISGKLSELAVRAVVHGVPVDNPDALANPEALELFRDIAAD